MAHRSTGEKFGTFTDRLADERARFSDRSAGHISIIQDQIAAISRGDFEAALSRADDDVELEIHAPPEFPFVRRAKGPANLRSALAHNFGAVEDQQPVISNVLAESNIVVIFGSERGRIKSTGQAYHVEFVHRFTFGDNGLQSIRIIVARVLSE
jgi:ketosteroid isomerase-like protein